MNSIIIVGNDVEDISALAWKHNTNYTVVEMTSKLTDNAISVIKESDMIVQCPLSIYDMYSEQDFMQLIDDIKCMVVFVQESETYDAFKYDNVLKKYPNDAIEYIRNKDLQGQDILEHFMTEQVLKGRLDGDKTV